MQQTLLFPDIEEPTPVAGAEGAVITTAPSAPAEAPANLPRARSMSGQAALQDLIKRFNGFRYRHGVYDVFRDFCELGACALSNSVDKHHFEEREKQYLSVIGKYTSEEADEFAKMLGALAIVLEADGPTDVLGRVFSQLEIHNRDAGQFFTPQCISDMMGALSFGDGLKQIIDSRGYITLQEPAAGAGSMIFGFCKAMKDAGYDYTSQLHVTAIDIDSRCAHMCYLQMSLLGIPGVVYIGDTLRMQMRSVWETPAHILGGWFLRRDEDGCRLGQLVTSQNN
jgi:hypothetical protein